MEKTPLFRAKRMGRADSSLSVTHIWVKGEGSVLEPDTYGSLVRCSILPGCAVPREASHLMYTQIPVPKVDLCL